MSSANFVELLRHRASTRTDERSLCFLTPEDGGLLTGENDWWTYGHLDRKARAIAAILQEASSRGERALLLYPPGLEYVAAFLGCLYAGIIAVPIYPPDPMRLNRTLPRIQVVSKDAEATVLLTTQPILSMSEMVFELAPEFRTLRWIATDSIDEKAASSWKEISIGSKDVAFLQYTSGSTGSPKGVVLTHGNLAHNSELIRRYMAIDESSFCVIWLPPYHDMGLIGGIMQPLYTGYPCALLSPLDFLRKPLRWLEIFTRMKGTIGGGPNFAYDLCVRKVTTEERDRLDLSTWKTAFNGAEPIRKETLERFAEYFAPCGFRPEAMFPCYGLAEATLMVSGGPHFRLPTVKTLEETGQNLVASGGPLGGQKIAIVHPETCEACASGRIGEIWVSGPSVAQGYWNRPEETEKTFGAHLNPSGEGPFLRTGDLGFLHEDQLFITGRLKDLIVIRGKNHYPQDIEQTVEKAHEAVRPGCVAAFSIDRDGEEHLVVVAELERRFHSADSAAPQRRQDHPEVDFCSPEISSAPQAPEIQRRIHTAILRHHEVHPYDVVLIKAGSIPKTSSGKIQRHACKSSFEKEVLDVISRLRKPPENASQV